MPKALLGTRFEDKYSSRQLKAIARYHLGIAKHLFIHIPKNGGLSLRNSRAMRRKMVLADPYFHKSKTYTQALAKEMAKHGFHHGNQHARLIDIHNETRVRLTAFAIVRNPWARTYSRFTYGLARQGSPDYSSKAFEAFLEQRHEWGTKPYFWHRAVKGWYPQLDYVCDEDGKISADILRLEHLQQDLSAYLGVTLERLVNQSGKNAPKYTDVYTDRSRQIVADWYAKDIDAFGFDFVGSARRNTLFGDAPICH